MRAPLHPRSVGPPLSAKTRHVIADWTKRMHSGGITDWELDKQEKGETPMTIIEALDAYFQSCPLMIRALHIEDVTEAPIVRRYIGGDAIRQRMFKLTGMEACQVEPLQDWIESQGRARQFPPLPNGRIALRLDCLETGSLYTPAGKPNRCQIQIRLTYYQGGQTR